MYLYTCVVFISLFIYLYMYLFVYIYIYMFVMFMICAYLNDPQWSSMVVSFWTIAHCVVPGVQFRQYYLKGWPTCNAAEVLEAHRLSSISSSYCNSRCCSVSERPLQAQGRIQVQSKFHTAVLVQMITNCETETQTGGTAENIWRQQETPSHRIQPSGLIAASLHRYSRYKCNDASLFGCQVSVFSV